MTPAPKIGVAEIEEAAKAEAIAKKTLRRAKQDLGVKAKLACWMSGDCS